MVKHRDPMGRSVVKSKLALSAFAGAASPRSLAPGLYGGTTLDLGSIPCHERNHSRRIFQVLFSPIRNGP